MDCSKFLSPAKINLSLNVIRKRPDGYHELRMVMTRISLYDEISLTLKSDGISLTSDSNDMPLGEQNIAWRAAEALIKAKGLDTGLHIDIKKKIPIGGGLGGGSSNAATLLMALNELTGKKATVSELMKIGLTLGADVPFFIFKGPAIAEGVGEKLSLLENLPQIWCILINPGLQIQTSEIFGKLNLELTKSHEEPKITGFNRSLSNISGICRDLNNDLEEVTFALYPAVREARDLLLKNGAVGALMSGSGSTVFGLYTSMEDAEIYYSKMDKKITLKAWRHYVASSLQVSPNI